MVPCEQHLHGEPVARSNSSDQDLVGCRLHRVLTVGSWISRSGGAIGSTICDGLRSRRPPDPRPAGQPGQIGPEPVDYHSPETRLATVASPERQWIHGPVPPFLSYFRTKRVGLDHESTAFPGWQRLQVRKGSGFMVQSHPFCRIFGQKGWDWTMNPLP